MVPTDWCNQLILYSKLDLSWSNPANILKDRKLRVRGDWKGIRLRDKVCGYLIFVTSLYAHGDIFVYSLLQLVSFSFLSSRFFVLLFIVFSHYYYYYYFLGYKFFCSRFFFFIRRSIHVICYSMYHKLLLIAFYCCLHPCKRSKLPSSQ